MSATRIKRKTYCFKFDNGQEIEIDGITMIVCGLLVTPTGNQCKLCWFNGGSYNEKWIDEEVLVIMAERKTGKIDFPTGEEK
jgi:hypothetical protein|nr:MAG TPA: hypothetical protein [Caudoviricetes sp.]